MKQSRLEERLRQEMQSCKLYLQLLSADECGGLASVYHQQAKAAGLPRLLWRHRQVDPQAVQDPDHKALLQDPELIFTADTVELQREVMNRLRPTTIMQQPGASLPLFVHHGPDDTHLLEAICCHLDRKNIAYEVPIPVEEPVEPTHRRQHIEKNLLCCERLLLIYCNSPQSWLKEQLNAYRRIGFQRPQAIHHAAICRKPNAPTGPKPPEIQVIDCPDDRVEPCLDSFLQGVRP